MKNDKTITEAIERLEEHFTELKGLCGKSFTELTYPEIHKLLNCTGYIVMDTRWIHKRVTKMANS